MKEDRLALNKAVDSGDTDMGALPYIHMLCHIFTSAPVYHVLLHLHKRLPLGSFFRLIEDGGHKLAPARRLLEVYAREQDREMLRDFYYSDDRRVESAIMSLDDASRATVSRFTLLPPPKTQFPSGPGGKTDICQNSTEVFLRGQGSQLRG